MDRKSENAWVTKYMNYKLEGTRRRDKEKNPEREIVVKDHCEAGAENWRMRLVWTIVSREKLLKYWIIPTK